GPRGARRPTAAPRLGVTARQAASDDLLLAVAHVNGAGRPRSEMAPMIGWAKSVTIDEVGSLDHYVSIRT
ncbi:hypothetical protein, partial [Streptomyces sp. Agncl-13]|uniref:hypothetical protein n=1 Tax=Streptomyces sp. Agncl-13 TaxID=3400628 RepID=UPI003A884CED